MGLSQDIKVVFVDDDTSKEILWIDGIYGIIREDDVVVLNDVEYRVKSSVLYLARKEYIPGIKISKSRITRSEYVVRVLKFDKTKQSEL